MTIDKDKNIVRDKGKAIDKHKGPEKGNNNKDYTLDMQQWLPKQQNWFRRPNISRGINSRPDDASQQPKHSAAASLKGNKI